MDCEFTHSCLVAILGWVHEARMSRLISLTLTAAFLAATFMASPAEARRRTCDAAVAPAIVDFTPDSTSFFYVTVELTNRAQITLGFEYDGDQWSFAEQYGTPGICQGQLDTFNGYTLSILTSASCAAPTVYTPAEEAVIAWYVQEAENFCQDNLPPSCSPVQTLALTPADASSVPLTPNGCGTTSWCALNQISAWTIPLCLAQPATVSDVTELVLTQTREESSLPWGTFMDRAGLSTTRFLVGTDGATLFSSLDALAGSSTVEGWYFAVPVACHNCTEFDVTTVLYYPETGFVMSLDGLYGWDS